MKKTVWVIVFGIIIGFIASKPALAVCPGCTIAVCAGLGLSRWLNVDDLLSGIWVGGLLASSLSWFVNWLKTKRFYRNIYFSPLIIFFYILTISPLFIGKIIGHPQNKYCFFNKIYIDRLLFGLIVGNISFMVGLALHNYLKRKNDGKSFFPFQKVVVPIVFLLMSTLIMYLIK